MAYAPTTHSSLLLRLRDARDEEAWGHCVQLYAPLVYQYARRHGLQDADSADVAQEVMRALMHDACRLDQIHRQGSLRSWLFTVTHHKVYDVQQRERRLGRASGESGTLALLNEQPSRDQEASWEREYRQQVFTWAAEQVRGQCSPTAWQAFWQTAVDGASAATVAEQLGLTVAAVYLAKSRVMARLKACIRQWEDQAESAVLGPALDGASS
jgi:RNA polymerase sigma-70 factor (ECF subfamily)